MAKKNWKISGNYVIESKTMGVIEVDYTYKLPEEVTKKTANFTKKQIEVVLGDMLNMALDGMGVDDFLVKIKSKVEENK